MEEVERNLWLSSMSQRAEAALHRTSRKQGLISTIFKVPHTIRAVDQDAYDPQVVSIGPYHRHGHERLNAMEDHKWRYLNEFLHRTPHRKLSEYVERVEALEVEARASYSSEIIPLDHSHEFAEIMVLDGCFLVELFLKLKDRPNANDDPVYSADWMMNCVARDLLLLENQIPFFILQSLFDLVAAEEPFPTSFLQLALDFFNVKKSENLELESKPFHHLLHLLHSHLLPLPPPNPPTRATELAPNSQPWKTSPLKSIPSATRLKEAGVKFHRKQKAGSLLDITFHKGVIEIPHLFIEDSTNSFLRNLVAFEQCFPACGIQFTIYALFMDFLVNDTHDVEILHKCQIIENGLGSNEDVMLVFNRMCKGLQVGYEKTHLSQLMEGVNVYYERKAKRRITLSCCCNYVTILSAVA